MSTPTRPSHSDVNNRMRLLLAATDAFAEHGYESASLRSIADAAGVSFQLITYYFGSKEELWLATVDYLNERYLETGKGLGFTVSGNVYEQFHNHLRLLLTDMLQRPQMRKIYIQEYFAGSDRYMKVIRPRIESFHKTLALPYYEEVVRLGIVKKFKPEEISLLFGALVHVNIVSPHSVELLVGAPTGSPKSVETQVDLIFRILTEEPEAEEALRAEPPPRETADGAAGVVVYPWRSARNEPARVDELQAENRRLKELIGDLALEKQVLLEQLRAARKERD